MSDFYVDHGAYSSALGTSPTWGVPQEGDGSGLSAATASSVASIVFTANCVAGNTVTVSGTVFTCVASGATGNQFNLGASLALSLANLVASLNASSTTVASGVAVGVPQFRNLYFARVTSSTTIEVMARIGSTTLNGATNSNCQMTVSGWATSTTLPVLFSGGTGGCWGWLLNSAAIGVSSSIAALAYGVVFGQPYVWTATPTINDITWCRSASGKTITYSAGTASISRSQSWPLRLLIDTNTKWTGDSGTGVVLFDITMTSASSGSNIFFAATGSVDVLVGAIAQGGGKFKLTCSGTGSSFAFGGGSAGNNTFALINFDVEDATTQSTSGMAFGQSGTGLVLYRGVRYLRGVAAAAIRSILSPNGGYATYIRFECCSFTWNITGVTDPGPVIVVNTTTAAFNLFFTGCSFTGWSSGGDKFVLMSGSASTTPQVVIVAENCTGLKLSSTYSGLVQVLGSLLYNPQTSGMLMQSEEPGSPYRLETRNGITEWDPGASPAYPLLTALQADGTTQWSLKVIWFNNGEVTQVNDFKACDLRLVSRLTAATRTITLQLFMRTALISALDVLKLSMFVTYISNTTGKVVTEQLNGIPVTSSASWTNAGSWSGYAAYKMSLTTSDSIKIAGLVGVSLRLAGRPNTSQNEVLFIDPEFGIA